MVARSRQAEATVGLATIHDLQKSYYYEDDRGYYHSGLHYGIDKCAAGNPREAGNELGFKLPDCTKARYRYLTNKGNDCAVSDGAIDQGATAHGQTRLTTIRYSHYKLHPSTFHYPCFYSCLDRAIKLHYY